MTDKTQARLQEIGRRTRWRRRQQENRLLFSLGLQSLLLLCGVGLLLKSGQRPGVAAVANGYGAVLLHNGAQPYVLVGVAAFLAGVMLTVLCLSLQKKHFIRTDTPKESENEP